MFRDIYNYKFNYWSNNKYNIKELIVYIICNIYLNNALPKPIYVESYNWNNINHLRFQNSYT